MAATGHRDQVRKGSGVPYIEHPMAVALILDRAGFDEETVIAAELDRAHLQNIRAKVPSLANRQPNAYRWPTRV